MYPLSVLCRPVDRILAGAPPRPAIYGNYCVFAYAAPATAVLNSSARVRKGPKKPTRVGFFALWGGRRAFEIGAR